MLFVVAAEDDPVCRSVAAFEAPGANIIGNGHNCRPSIDIYLIPSYIKEKGGCMRNEKGQFVACEVSIRLLPIGTIRTITRHKRNGAQRNRIKIGPKKYDWIDYARFVWEFHHGSLPKGYGVHHLDGNPLNDDISNLRAVSKSEHLKTHRPAFNDKRVASVTSARRRLRWSTKSKTKRNGRHDISWSDDDLKQAIAAVREKRLGIMAAAHLYGMSDTTIRARLK